MRKNFTLANGIHCYMEETEAYAHLEDINKINREITIGLTGTGFSGLKFYDESVEGIQVRLFHKDVEGFSFDDVYPIKRDWSNVDDVITHSIESFKKNTTPARINIFTKVINEKIKHRKI